MAENLESSTTSVEPTPPAPSPERHFGMGSLIIVPSLLAAVIFGQQGSRTTATPAAAAAPAPEAPADPAGRRGRRARSLPNPRVSSRSSRTCQRSSRRFMGKSTDSPSPSLLRTSSRIEGKIDEVSKSITVAKPLLEKVDKLGGRIGDVGKQIESLQSEVVALKQHKSDK